MNLPIYSRAAQGDLEDIWTFIARDSPSAADIMEEEIRAEVMRLADLPSLGHRRHDLTAHDLRFHTVRKNYLIVYQEGETLEIVRILHGSRNAVHELGFSR